jgi:hypothetical protein
VLAELRERKIEPPTLECIERLIRSACATYVLTLCTQVMQRLDPKTRTLLDGLLERSVAIEEQDEQADDEPPNQETARREIITWKDLKTNPGAVGLESVLYEIDKLRVLSQLALPADLFREASPHVISLYRQHAATETLYEPSTISVPHAAFVCTSISARLAILPSHVSLGAGAKSRLMIGNNFSKVPRFRNPSTLIFPVH